MMTEKMSKSTIVKMIVEIVKKANTLNRMPRKLVRNARQVNSKINLEKLNATHVIGVGSTTRRRLIIVKHAGQVNSKINLKK